MERTPVQSKEIAVVGYDAQKSILEIVFRRGGVYHYEGVPSRIHKEFLAAPSLGTYFTQNIKDAYGYTKVA